MKFRILTLGITLILITGSGLAQNNSSIDDLNSTNDTEILNQSQALNNSSNMNQQLLQNNQTQSNESLSTVMIASSESHIDGTLADTASERLGVPVILTDPDQLNDATRDQLDSLNIENTIIIGGPAALSENVEEEINTITETEAQRIYGETASDTSIEVAETFWPEGYSQVEVVEAPLMTEEQETYRLLSAVVNIAEGNPVLVADMEDSEQVVEEVQSQNLDEATVYTLGNESNLEQNLGSIDGNAEFNQGSIEDLTTPIYSQIQENPENRELFTLTGADFTYGLPTYAHPSGVTYVATSDNINETSNYITNSEYVTVNLIGEQELAGEITSQINETGVQTQFIQVEDASETSAEILENNTQEWIAQANTDLIQQTLGTNQETSQNMTQNQTENETEMNESEFTPSNETEQNQSGVNDSESGLPPIQDGTGTSQSSIQLNSDESTVTAEASYTSERPYVKRLDVNQNETGVTFLFELIPAEDANQTQEEYEYTFNEEIELDAGDYQTRAELIVDGQTVDTATGTAQIQ